MNPTSTFAKNQFLALAAAAVMVISVAYAASADSSADSQHDFLHRAGIPHEQLHE